MLKRSISFVILVVFIWLIWSYSGRNLPLSEPESYISIIEEINPTDTLDRNIIGIQPYMMASDYVNAVKFKQKIRQYLVAATEKGFIRDKTIILYPDYIGTWLVLLGEKHALAEKETLKEAISTFILSNVFDFFLGYIKTGDEEDKSVSAILRMKSKVMASVYYNTFSELAKETRAHIVAGTIVLPGPYVSNGELFVENKKNLQNVSFVFGPDGKIVGEPIVELYPNSSELKFISEPESKRVQTIEFPFTKSSILIDHDSWYPQLYNQANSSGSEITLVPSFQTGSNSMDSLWKGFDKEPNPSFLNKEDMNQIKVKEAWSKYSLANPSNGPSNTISLNVFLRGEFWELGTDGQTFVTFKDSILNISQAEKAGIWSLNY
ncbi:hypothetical protein [Algoriphagus sp.]|uniref:hypothetical protein n=1 Tax=Algoriphagus sp. TaxID=1872435 RepID=UPI0025D91E4C|nr:hypothetical protein [Algoriphagus sp.]